MISFVCEYCIPLFLNDVHLKAYVHDICLFKIEKKNTVYCGQNIIGYSSFHYLINHYVH